MRASPNHHRRSGFDPNVPHGIPFFVPARPINLVGSFSQSDVFQRPDPSIWLNRATSGDDSTGEFRDPHSPRFAGASRPRLPRRRMRRTALPNTSSGHPSCRHGLCTVQRWTGTPSHTAAIAFSSDSIRLVCACLLVSSLLLGGATMSQRSSLTQSAHFVRQALTAYS
jgi:hypothetical protein